MNSPEQTYCGNVAITGKPNVGKSTLLNALARRKVSIVSSKPGTTQRRVFWALTRGRHQVIFHDTPGLFPSTRAFDRLMERAVERALDQIDAVLLVAELTGVQPEDRDCLERIHREAPETPIVLVINKCDLAPRPERFLELDAEWERLHPFRELVHTSALLGKGLDLLWEAFTPLLPARPFEADPDCAELLQQRAHLCDLIREKLLECTRDEVPHSVAVVIEHVEVEDDVTHILANLIVERQGQKGILIGKQGRMIKQLGTLARGELETILGTKVFLDLSVKVRKRWRSNPSRLREYGFDG